MARKRMIDPSIWFNEDLKRFSYLQRLLYIGLFSNADDEGRLRGSATYLKSLIFPYDRLKPTIIYNTLKDMNKAGLIEYYKVNDEWYIQHPNWRKHQYIDKARASMLPPSPTRSLPAADSSALNTIQQQQKTTEQNITQQNPIESNKESVIELLQSVGMTKMSAVVLKQSFPEELIRKAYEQSIGKRSRAGYIIEALKKGWIK